jgi:hypothetical protein
MLKTIILLVLIAFPPTLQQRMAEGENSDLLVVKFSWAKERQNRDLIRGAQNPGARMTTPISNDQDLDSRKAEIRNVDRKATKTVGDPGDGYRLVLEVKNEGTRIVKSLIWEFRPTAGPDDYEPKQYLCALRVKPKQKKTLSQWTPFAPVKVVSVAARSDALKDGEVVINKIEYADGSVWTKRKWNYELPPDSSKKVSEGTCSVF